VVAHPDVARAVEVLRAGGLVAFPTETVYGLGADAANEAAVRRIFAVKGRPVDHPVIVHVGQAAELAAWAAVVPPAAERLAAALWPGPLTLLVERAPHVLDVVTGGRPTVGVRVPDQPIALELLRAFGGGIAAPSANRFAKVSPTTADHVRADLGVDVAFVLDGGPCTIGVESTIVDCTTDPPVVLRPGGVSIEQLELVLGGPVEATASGPSRAPGMMASHYAPRCRVELAPDRASAGRRVDELRAEGATAGLLDPRTGVEDYAQHLYTWLRRADEDGLDVLVCVAPSGGGLALAVRDRLQKAAAPRPTAEDAG
jgi:L-threonylcarbamoyladenylate synthase